MTTTRQAVSLWLKDADQIPGHELIAKLATEHDALLNALEFIVRMGPSAIIGSATAREKAIEVITKVTGNPSKT
jgi:hypothetical protein